jgi:hypothetical protein
MANTFLRAVNANIGATAEPILTATAKTVVIGLTLANVTGSSITASVQLTTTGEDPYIVKNIPIPSGSSVEIMAGNKIVMNSGDILKVSGSVATSVDATMSYMEIS